MSDEYTPSTEIVRDGFRFAQGYYGDTAGKAEFDRWLAAERARIWNECCDTIDSHELNTQQAREGNPYRTGGDV